MSGAPEVERLIDLMAKLPGLGPRSARRAVLHLVKRKERLLGPLAASMDEVVRTIRTCRICENVTTSETCEICEDPRRANGLIAVVQDVADLWAMERAAVFRGRYHVLGGLLSALDGITPETLRLPELAARVRQEEISEVILALSATIDGQTTAHVVAEYLDGTGCAVTSLAKGVPIGGELDYLDDGTISAALTARKAL
ncbi:MAG: recombination mediator RecR [Pseudomonadota bacterium]